MKLEYLLGADAYTTVNKKLAKAIGIPQAMFLQELISQRARFRKQYGVETFYFSQEKMKEEIGISEKTQQRYTNELVKLGFIKVEKKGIPARNYYTIIDMAIINSEIFSDIMNGETSSDNLTEQGEIYGPDIKQETISRNNKSEKELLKEKLVVEYQLSQEVVDVALTFNEYKAGPKLHKFKKPQLTAWVNKLKHDGLNCDEGMIATLEKSIASGYQGTTPIKPRELKKKDTQRISSINRH